MQAPVRSMVPERPYHLEAIAPGVTLRRLYPGGKAGPDNAVAGDIPGGQTWSENFILGEAGDAFQMLVPDIRMPANQLWPMHWHDCWTVVIIVEGSCMVGDWTMREDDVFVAAPSIEYGPLLIGPHGCRLLEIFADLALSPGGYAPEYHDHPTLLWGQHVIKPREGVNRRNEGHSSLSLEGAEGMWKSRLAPGWSWELGAPADPDRGHVRLADLAPGGTIPACTRGDAYGALVLAGSFAAGGHAFGVDDVLIAARGSAVPELRAGPDGARVLEHFRTARGL